MTARLQALDNLASKVPLLNNKVAQQQQQAMAIQFQNTAAQAPQSRQAAMGLATQQQAANDQIDNQALQQTGQQVAQIDQAKTQEMALQNQMALSGQQMQDDQVLQQEQLRRTSDMSTAGMELDNRLFGQSQQNEKDMYAIEKELGQNIFSSRRAFSKAGADQSFMSTRQAADWMVLNSKDNEEFQDKVQVVEQAHKRSMTMNQLIQAELVQRLKNDQSLKLQGKNSAFQAEMADKANKLKEQMTKDANKAAMTGMIFKGVGTVVGAVVGTYAANPVLGAAIGGALGEAAAGAVNKM